MKTVALRQAEWWWAKGYSPIPTQYRSRRPLVKWSRYKDEQPTHDDLLSWFGTPGMRNMQVTLSSHRIVIDFDVPGAMEKWDYKVPTLRVASRRGDHFHYRLREPIAYSAAFWGGEILGPNHLILVPPSTHPKGNRYQGNGHEIATIDSLADIGLELPPKSESADRPEASLSFHRIQLPTDYDFSPGSSPLRQIKASYTMTDILALFGIEVSRQGLCRCPFHDDNRPSMHVRTKTAKCLKASCAGHKNIGVIDMAMYLYGASDISEVIARLRGA